MAFDNSEEVTKCIVEIFENAFGDAEIKPKLTEPVSSWRSTSAIPTPSSWWTCRTRWSPTDRREAGTVGDDDHDFRSRQRLLTGKVDLPMAMAKRKVEVDGNVASLLKLAPLGKKLYAGYVQRLKDDGREDLIVVEALLCFLEPTPPPRPTRPAVIMASSGRRLDLR